MIRYSGKHMFGLGTVHATFNIRDGELYVGDLDGYLDLEVDAFALLT